MVRNPNVLVLTGTAQPWRVLALGALVVAGGMGLARPVAQAQTFCSGPLSDSLDGHVASGRATVTTESDCSGCYFGVCGFPSGCTQSTSTYVASGSGESLGSSGGAGVTLYESPAGYFSTQSCTVVSCDPYEASCGDGQDDDCDGLVDCADSDCASACTSCGDGVCDSDETASTCPGDCEVATCQCAAELSEQQRLIDSLVALARHGGDAQACICEQATCGNGAVEGTDGTYESQIATDAMLLLYAPDRTGSEATGWSCAPLARHTCVCEGSCGNDAVGGDDGDVDTGITPTRLLTAYHPGRTGGRDTGWVCGAETSYTCLCEGSCGNNAVGGNDGDITHPVSAEEMITRWAPHRTGGAATGWVCQPDGRHTCVCEGSCGNGGVGGSNGDIHTGLSSGTVLSRYRPHANTGWRCTLDQL